MVADVERRYHEDDVFRDVGRMVADALEMPGDQDQVERRFNRGRILQHVVQKLAENLRLQAVEPVVFVQHRLRQHLSLIHI